MKLTRLSGLCALSLASCLAAPYAQAGVQVSSSVENLRVDIINNKGVQTFLPITSTTGDTLWAQQLGLEYDLFDGNSPTVLTAPAFTADATHASLSTLSPFGSLSASAHATEQGLNFAGQFTSLAPVTPPPDTGVDTVHYSVETSVYPSGVWGSLKTDNNASSVFELPVHGGLWLPAMSTATISGTLGLNAAAGIDDLLVDASRVNFSAYASTLVTAYMVTDGTTLAEAQDSKTDSLDWLANAFGTAGITNLAPTDDHKTFQLTFENTSTEGTWLLLGTTMTVDSQQTILAGTGAIPEPGTWALMSLGLVGIGLSRRAKAQRERICA